MSKVYETAIKIGASISKTFKGDTNSAAASLMKLSGAAKQLKAAEKAAGSVKKLNEAVGASKAKYNQASAALRQLEVAEKTAGKATKESTAWRKAGEKEVARYAKEMDRATKAAEKNAAAMRSIPHLRYESARERLFGARKGPAPLAEKAGGQLRGIAGDAAILGTAALGAGAALAGLVLKSLKAGDEIGDTAEKLGIGTTALQELRYGAIISGAEVGSLDQALKKMAVSVGHFKAAKGKGGGGGLSIPGLQSLDKSSAEGGGGADNPFKKIGLDAKKLSTLKPEEQIKKIADGLSKLKTHSDRAAAAQAIFGKGAADILPFLESGAVGIDKLSKNAHKFGGVLSVDAIKAADEADRAMKDAEMAFSGVANTLGAALLPTATKVFSEFSNWVINNKGEIQKWATDIAMWVETKGIPALMKIGAEVKSFAEKVMWLVGGAAKLVGGFDNLGIVIAGLRFAPFIKSLTEIGIEGTKAAVAVLKLAAANSGGGAGGAGGGLLGKIGMVGAAGLAGYAAGTAADEYFGISDAISGTGRSNRIKSSEDEADVERNKELQFKVAKIRAQNEQNRLARMGAPKTGGAGGNITVAPQVTIGSNATRQDVSNGMDAAKNKVLADFDGRLSFAQ